MAETASLDTAPAETVQAGSTLAETGAPLSGGLAARATLFDHLAMMRLDHATKHVFILPGVVLALLLRGAPLLRDAPGRAPVWLTPLWPTVWPVAAGALTAILVA